MWLDMLQPGWQHRLRMSASANLGPISRAPAMARNRTSSALCFFTSPPLAARGYRGRERGWCMLPTRCVRQWGLPIEPRYGTKALLLALAVLANSLLPAPAQTNAPAVVLPTNAPAGPTIQLDFGGSQTPGNPVSTFMYFVPLISPEPVTSVTSPGSTQVARVLSAKRKTTPNSFGVTCEFEFNGTGSQQSVFDLTPNIRRHLRKLKAGGSTGRQLSMITVGGPGSGVVEVEGTISNRVETVSEVRLRFNAHGKTSPIAIEVCDVRFQEGEFRHVDEIIARVNSLTFVRKAGKPKMEVTVSSVKKKNAGNSLWQNFKGSVVGMAVNLFIPPLTVEAVGHQAMLDFGRALAVGAKTFTFPRAANLQ